MRLVAVVPMVLGCTLWTQAQQVGPAPAASPASSPAPRSQPATPSDSSQALPQALASEAGYMEPAQVKVLLQKIWRADFRINDLLTQVHPERWKLSDGARGSFGQMLETLRAQLAALEQWRSQFDTRTDSVYLGFETYAAIQAVLPRLDGVARSVSRYENASLGAQYSQAGNQLFDLQQALVPYLSFLLRNQDQLFHALQTNLAACENSLGEAMRGRTEPAKPMKNILPQFKGRRRTKPVPAPGGRN